MRTPPPDTGAQWGMITPYTRQGQEPRTAGPLQRWKAYGERCRSDHNELTERENSEAERACLGQLEWRSGLAFGRLRRFDRRAAVNHLIHQAEVPAFLSRHIGITLQLPFNRLDRLTGVTNVDFIQALAQG